MNEITQRLYKFVSTVLSEQKDTGDIITAEYILEKINDFKNLPSLKKDWDKIEIAELQKKRQQEIDGVFEIIEDDQQVLPTRKEAILALAKQILS